MRLIAALAACVVLGAGLAACGSDNVATVAGNPISKQAFDHWIYVAAKGQTAQTPGAPVIVPSDPPNFQGCIKQVRKQLPSLAKTTDAQLKKDCNQLFQSLSSQVMDFLTRAYWYQAEAAKRHIKITDAQVKQSFQQQKQSQFPTPQAFNAFLAQSGQTMQDLLFRVRVNELLKRLLAQSKTQVTPATIAAYYKAHAAQFGTPEKRDVRLVRTQNPQQAAAAKAALQSGQGWPAVAKQYSQDTQTKSKGGLLSGVTRGQEEQALDKVVFSSPAGKINGPIHGTFGYYVVQVVKIHPGNQQSLQKATPLIRQLLQGQGQQNAQTTLDNEVKKDWMPKTTCASAYAMANCKGYKASSSSSSALGNTGAPSQGQTGAPSQGNTGAPSQAAPQTGTPQPQTQTPAPSTPQPKQR